MQTFATVEDVTNSWANKRFNDSERLAAKELIERASAMIGTRLARRQIEIDPEDELQATNLKAVTVAVVRRAMNGGDVDGVQGATQTIGSTTASVQYINNYGGSMKLLPSEEDLLGITTAGGRIGWSNL